MASASDLAAWDHAYLWHPFTQMQDWLAEEPLVIARGEGNYLIDTRGRRYFDGVSSLWCNVHGHAHPELNAALEAQARQIAHTTLLGLGSVPSIELGRELIAIAPSGSRRVFYSDAGATAVEIALKLAIQYWHLRGQAERRRFVSLTEAYHGDTLGAVGVGYSEAFHHFFRPFLFEPPLKLDPPHVFRWQQGLDAEAALERAIDQATRVFEGHGGQIAATIAEPIMQGAAGMWHHPPAYLKTLHDLTKRAGALFIADEVATGFGRTGTMFAVQQAEVAPDLLCIGKGLTGGYLPLAATLATEEIFDSFLAPYEEFRAFFHGHTYTGNALACAVALANLRIFERDAVVVRAASLAEILRGLLAQHIMPLTPVGDIRQAGLMAGIELVRDRERRTPYPPADRIGARVCQYLRRLGIILRPLGSVVVLMPPLSSTPAELETLVRGCAEAIQVVAAAQRAA